MKWKNRGRGPSVVAPRTRLAPRKPCTVQPPVRSDRQPTVVPGSSPLPFCDRGSATHFNGLESFGVLPTTRSRTKILFSNPFVPYRFPLPACNHAHRPALVLTD